MTPKNSDNTIKHTSKMTPKEKAVELIWKFIDNKIVANTHFIESINQEVYSSDVEFDNSKKAAIIVAEESMKVCTIDDILYWKQVVYEIESY